MKVTPVPGCRICWGTGEVTDWVDWGSAQVPLVSFCDCVTDQVEDDEEIVPVEELDDRDFSKTLPHSAWWDLCPLAFP